MGLFKYAKRKWVCKPKVIFPPTESVYMKPKKMRMQKSWVKTLLTVFFHSKKKIVHEEFQPKAKHWILIIISESSIVCGQEFFEFDLNIESKVPGRSSTTMPGNSSVNTVQHATIEEAMFSVDPTDAPVDWMDSDHVICVYCRSTSVPRLYNESREL
jgi:hypothetical protein